MVDLAGINMESRTNNKIIELRKEFNVFNIWDKNARD